MKCISAFIILLAINNCTLGQEIDFLLAPVSITKKDIETKELRIIYEYNYTGYTFTVGLSKDTARINLGLRMFINDPQGNYIYKSRGQMDSFWFEPYIFQSPKSKKFIVIAERGAEYSWGATALLIDNNNVLEIGNLDIGIVIKVFDDKNDPSSYVPGRIHEYLIITESNESIEFSFVGGKKAAIDPCGRNERRIPSEDVKYIWNGNELELIENKQNGL
jgi:hypothetical protein